jgi:hypothetical protein
LTCAGRFGFSILKPEPDGPSTKSMTTPSRRAAAAGATCTVTPPLVTLSAPASGAPRSRLCSQRASTDRCTTSPGPASASAVRSTSPALAVTVTAGAFAGAAALARSPRTLASSPDSWSWRTMSEPPTSSPRTYSCGKVGQFDSSLSPLRTSGSLRTLTVVYRGIKVLRMLTTDAENPHCGKLRVPFMKRTTSSEAIICSSFWRCSGVKFIGAAPCRIE